MSEWPSKRGCKFIDKPKCVEYGLAKMKTMVLDIIRQNQTFLKIKTMRRERVMGKKSTIAVLGYGVCKFIGQYGGRHTEPHLEVVVLVIFLGGHEHGMGAGRGGGSCPRSREATLGRGETWPGKEGGAGH